MVGLRLKLLYFSKQNLVTIRTCIKHIAVGVQL